MGFNLKTSNRQSHIFYFLFLYPLKVFRGMTLKLNQFIYLRGWFGMSLECQNRRTLGCQIGTSPGGQVEISPGWPISMFRGRWRKTSSGCSGDQYFLAGKWTKSWKISKDKSLLTPQKSKQEIVSRQFQKECPTIQ